MRLDKLLSHTGYGTRKEVKKLLKTGAIKVNEMCVKDAKTQVDPQNDTVSVYEEMIHYQPLIYLMLNKPKGVISATEDQRHKTVVDLLESTYQRYEPFPVGRLDKDTEGLLLLTNDGQFSHSLMSPKKHVKKTYIAEVAGLVTDEDRLLFQKGVKLDDGYWTKPAELIILKAGEVSTVQLTITEGKFHQVKRMFEAVGKKVTELKRTQIANLRLDETLKLGGYRELREDEWPLLFNDPTSQ
ncbi:pseudouridine synthase [Halalkalibacter hemicellulosilyticus]|uniref:Pseudouridine synthase n=1 Tax=Halalkalibacter hemicellulosilyticusJCM 9152 TaxID=1236971 RepID=W4QJV6_9BACI|nr:pseudouridine synthase [Halalkalibacter hemicellulosilyticus]GAE32366.1 ribosomal small subunit pseudouridine synthase A [Halalkalibacter hemicellulosilyticusJCM 9152]